MSEATEAELAAEVERLLLVMAIGGAGIDPTGLYPGTPGFKLLLLYAERDAAESAVERVRELHKPFTKGWEGEQWCKACSPAIGEDRYVLVAWPCPTVAALDATPKADVDD